MEQTKDYSLLRPFDLEAAKAGELLFEIYMHGSKVKTDEKIGTYIAGPNNHNEYVISFPTNGYVTYTDSIKDVRMAPLAWVEGKPVYTGDTLYSPFFKSGGYSQDGLFTVTGYRVSDGHSFYAAEISYSAATLVSSCSWNKPKVKKSGWLNIYPNNDCSCMHPSKLAADTEKAGHREACIEVFWEA